MENKTTIRSTPKDVFLHLLNILTFYFSIIGFIMLYIQYIGALFPDPLTFNYSSIAGAVRWSTSVLIIAIPVYLLTAWMLARDIAGNKEKRELSLRKWLTYFTLFISAVTIIVDLITFVYNFMSGEISTQFFLKVLVVLIVAAAVFGYYIWDLKRKELKSKTPKVLAFIVSFAVLASVVLGFFIIGTPAEQRDRRFDERRVNDLQMLQNQIINYRVLKDALPESLSDLEDSISGFKVPTDPETDAQYEYYYTTLDCPAFELCATFKTSSNDFGFSEDAKSLYYDRFQQNWEHDADRTCFVREMDLDLYKTEGNGVIRIKEVIPSRY